MTVIKRTGYETNSSLIQAAGTHTELPNKPYTEPNSTEESANGTATLHEKTTHPTEKTTHPTEKTTHPTEKKTHPTEKTTHQTEKTTHPTVLEHSFNYDIQTRRKRKNGDSGKNITNGTSTVVKHHTLRNMTSLRRKNIDNVLPVPKLTFPAAAAVVFLISVLCFCVSYDGEFLFDDVKAITNNRDVLPETPLSEIFRNDYWGQRVTSPSSHKSYRPITVLTFRLCYYLGGGLTPAWFHVPNILLHGTISIMLLRVFSFMFGGYRLNPETRSVEFVALKSALLCTILFAVHPIHTECVAGIVGRADLLCALTFLTSFLFYIRSCADEIPKTKLALSRPTSFSVKHMLASMLICFLSVFCKEQGITVLGICSVYDVVLVCHIRPKDILASRSYEKSGSYNDEIQMPKKTVACNGDGTNTPKGLNYNYLYALNAWILVHPWWLCCDWSMGCIPVIKSIFDPRVLGAVAFWAVIGALLFTSFSGSFTRDRRILTMALAFIVVPFLPASNLFFRVGFVIAERILYLPSIGFCMLVVLGIRHICARHPKQVQTVKIGVACLIIIFVLRSIQRSFHWRTSASLFYDGERVCPLNAKIHFSIAYHLDDIGQTQASADRYRHAIKLNNRYYDAYNNLANLMRENKSLEESARLLQRAVELRQNFVRGWLNLGLTYEEMGKYVEAEKCYLTGLRHQPNHFKTLTNLARLYYTKLQLPDKAIEVWWNGTIVRPSEATNWYNIAAVLYNRDKYEETIDVIQQALHHVTGYPKLVSLLALIYKKQGKWQMSEKLYLDALQLETNNDVAYANLGLFYADWKKYELAEKYYRQSLQINPRNEGVKGNLQQVLQKTGQL